MKKILIADAGKASMVLTSEVFKDHFLGVQVVVAKTSAETVELAKNDSSLDAIIIDFDLPDRDGAQTAARIKKTSQVPILMTGFDRPDVQEGIEDELSAYEDCLNWIRKPVKPELMVEIARRYCDGKYRTKRRIPCEIPAFFELAVEVQNTPETPAAAAKGRPLQTKKTIDKNAKAKKVQNPKVVTTIKKTKIPALILDCSLGGLKIRVSRDRISTMTLGKYASNAVNDIKSGEILSIQLPAWGTISNLENEVRALSGGAATPAKKPGAAQKTDSAATHTSMRGKVAWVNASVDRASWTFGIQCENLALSKKLFDSILQAMKTQN